MMNRGGVTLGRSGATTTDEYLRVGAGLSAGYLQREAGHLALKL